MRPFGVLAEFAGPDAVVRAARALRARGYSRLEAYTPFPVPELEEALGLRKPRLPAIVFAGGVIGGVGAYAMQVYLMAVDYPLNVGGRPLHSWPSFIPVTFEMTVLVASLTAVIGMLARSGLPRPHHPVFHVARFAHASSDAFFLSVESRDEAFDPSAVEAALQDEGATEVWVVDA